MKDQVRTKELLIVTRVCQEGTEHHIWITKANNCGQLLGRFSNWKLFAETSLVLMQAFTGLLRFRRILKFLNIQNALLGSSEVLMPFVVCKPWFKSKHTIKLLSSRVNRFLKTKGLFLINFDVREFCRSFRLQVVFPSRRLVHRVRYDSWHSHGRDGSLDLEGYW